MQAKKLPSCCAITGVSGAGAIKEGLLAGLLSSSCCVLQLLLNFFSVGCAGFNKVLGPYRTHLRVVSWLWLWLLWLRTLRTEKGGGSQHLRKLSLTTVLTLSLMFLPEILRMSGGPAVAPPTHASDHVRFVIDGMGCEACQFHVQSKLDRAAGVISSDVDFEEGRADVYIAKGWGFNLSFVTATLAEDGYEVTNVLNISAGEGQHQDAATRTPDLFQEEKSEL